MKLDPRAAIAIAVLVIIGVSAYSFASLPYAGGGEVGSSLSLVKATGDGLSRTWHPAGQHYWPNYEQYSDLDGNFEDYNWTRPGKTRDGKTESDIQLPSVIVESGYPYYLEYLGTDDSGDPIYRSAEDEAIAEKEYEKTYTVDGVQKTYRYLLLNYGTDVTIKTDADRYQKEGSAWILTSYGTGWNYERKDVDVDVLINFGLSPWVPAAEWNESYKIIDGWAGIISAQVYQKEQGFVADNFEDPEYEQHLEELEDSGVVIRKTDSVIQSTNSLFTSLNMYLPRSGDVYQEIDFESPDELVGVKNAINIEVSAQLGAGAQYISGALAEWTNVAVQNVFVTYHIVVKLVATIELKLIAEGDKIAAPDENNQLGNPPPIPILSPLAEMWNEFWADVAEFFMSPIGILYTVLILVIIAGVVYFVIKVFARRGG